jgi:hypothetical protein
MFACDKQRGKVGFVQTRNLVHKLHICHRCPQNMYACICRGRRRGEEPITLTDKTQIPLPAERHRLGV